MNIEIPKRILIQSLENLNFKEGVEVITELQKAHKEIGPSEYEAISILNWCKTVQNISKDRKVYLKNIEIMENLMETCDSEFVKIDIKQILAITHYTFDKDEGFTVAVDLLNSCMENHYGCLPSIVSALFHIT